jgi:hypothetical protein
MWIPCCGGPKIQTKCGEIRGSRMRSKVKREVIYAFRKASQLIIFFVAIFPLIFPYKYVILTI